MRIDLEEEKDNEDFYASENSYLIEEKPENEEKSTVKAGKSSMGDQSLQRDIQNEVRCWSKNRWRKVEKSHRKAQAPSLLTTNSNESCRSTKKTSGTEAAYI